MLRPSLNRWVVEIALIVTTSSQIALSALLLILSDLRGKIEPDKATAHCIPKPSE